MFIKDYSEKQLENISEFLFNVLDEYLVKDNKFISYIKRKDSKIIGVESRWDFEIILEYEFSQRKVKRLSLEYLRNKKYKLLINNILWDKNLEVLPSNIEIDINIKINNSPRKINSMISKYLSTHYKNNICLSYLNYKIIPYN